MRYLTIILLLFSYCAFGQTNKGATPNLRNGLELFLKLEDTNFRDETGSLTVTNNGVTITTGKVGNGGDFEDTESDYLTLGDNLGFDAEDPFTFLFWVKLETSTNQFFISKQLNSGNFTGYGFFYVPSVPELRFELTNDNSPSKILSEDYSITLSTGTWYHFAVRNDGGRTPAALSVYRDASEVTATTSVNTLAGNTIVSSAPFLISSRGNGSVFPIDGVMDEVKVYNRELKVIEIQQDYNSGNGLLYVYENFKNGKISFNEYLAYYLDYLKYNS